ncbi:hypothetical protein ABEB36_015129 [Hypothenemus hampei]|uniref:Uncharacterized protein n=1 Tax=Hypothenemus hampei TaxID=57062 RepID=A0ABD1E533_HYPHA
MMLFQIRKRFVFGFQTLDRQSALKRKPPGRPRSVRTPENVAAVKASVEQSPRRSAAKHAAALRLSDQTNA